MQKKPDRVLQHNQLEEDVHISADTREHITQFETQLRERTSVADVTELRKDNK